MNDARSGGRSPAFAGPAGCPPRLARWILDRCLPSGTIGLSIRGDLHQEFEEIAEAHPGRSPRGWYWRESSKLGARFLIHRLQLRLGLADIPLGGRSRRRPGPLPSEPKGKRMGFENLLQDLRFGARTLVKNPGFATVAILTLALGVGANTAMFSVLHGVLIRPLNVEDYDRLVMVKKVRLDGEADGGETTAGNFTDWHALSTSFQAMTTLDGATERLTGFGDTRRARGSRGAGEGILEVAGVPALFGRTLTAADNEAGDTVVVLSYGFWESLYADDRDVLGETITLDTVPHTIIGIMPARFSESVFGHGQDYWAPSTWSDEDRQNRTNYSHHVVARLAPGVTRQQAQDEMQAVMAQLREEYPAENRAQGVELLPLQNELVEDIDTLLALLMGAVGLVLLIACVNLANLLLARATSRQQEVAVRRALGATPVRLVRQMLTEAVLLGLIGGAAGMLLSLVFLDALIALLPSDVPFVSSVSIDRTALLFTVSVSVLAGVAFGLIPALRLGRQASMASVSRSAVGGKETGKTGWAWSALVVSEVALSVVVLVAAGLLLRSFSYLINVDPGFRTGQVLTFTVSLPDVGYEEDEQRRLFWQELRGELEAIPAVSSASFANQMPSELNRMSGWLNYADHPVELEDYSYMIPYRVVTAGHFETLGMPLVQGRYLTERDDLSAPGCIVNEAAAKRFWPNGDPLDDRVTIGSYNGDLWFPPLAVVGVVGNVRNNGLGAETAPAIYIPYAVAERFGSGFRAALRTTVDPNTVVALARTRVRDLEPQALFYREMTVEEMYREQVAPTRSVMLLIGIFAGLGLLMAAIGVFGVLSYSVNRRTRELGVRIALGADAIQVTMMVVRQAMTKVLLGTAIGIVGAIAAGRFIASVLFGVSAFDPLTFIATTVLLAMVALAASYLPARRAARVQPVDALRTE